MNNLQQDENKCRGCLWWENSGELCGRCFHPETTAAYTSPNISCMRYENCNQKEIWWAFRENKGLIGKAKSKSGIMRQLGLQKSVRIKSGVYRVTEEEGKHAIYIYHDRELAAADNCLT